MKQKEINLGVQQKNSIEQLEPFYHRNAEEADTRVFGCTSNTVKPEILTAIILAFYSDSAYWRPLILAFYKLWS